MTAPKQTTISALAVIVGLPAMIPSPALSHGKGMYDTKAEAEKRAQEIGCEGVHENNGRWMPCLDEADLHNTMRRQ